MSRMCLDRNGGSITWHVHEKAKHIAVDGKTSRRSFDRTKDRSAVHTVSAWLSDAGLVWGQYKTAAKSNEITAIPRLLRIIDIRGATITIDAMGCQTDIAKVIVKQGGDYILAVKEVARLIRRHWSIENELHRVLDMAFHEDAARHRTGN